MTGSAVKSERSSREISRTLSNSAVSSSIGESSCSIEGGGGAALALFLDQPVHVLDERGKGRAALRGADFAGDLAHVRGRFCGGRVRLSCCERQGPAEECFQAGCELRAATNLSDFTDFAQECRQILILVFRSGRPSTIMMAVSDACARSATTSNRAGPSSAGVRRRRTRARGLAD
jgi:hypothetical protein